MLGCSFAWGAIEIDAVSTRDNLDTELLDAASQTGPAAADTGGTLKFALDRWGAVVALVVMAPVIGAVAIAVLCSVGRPILFHQTRVGLGGVDFELRKFRTMRDLRDPAGALLPDELRCTRLGRLLRRTRMDELPELWNIWQGEMSFVGPRPLPRALLGDEVGVMKRHMTRPGLTGLAQVSGNTLLRSDEKIAIDVHYNTHRCLTMDAYILVRTAFTVVFGEKRNEKVLAKACDRRA